MWSYVSDAGYPDIGKDGTVKLGDFGLAVALDRTRLTQDGAMVGTATYMPPEHAVGGDVTPQSDLYSLGALLYELAAGSPPFDGPSLEGVILAVLTHDIIPLEELRLELPPGLACLVNDCLSKSPADRPATATIVLKRLSDLH